MRRLCLWIAGLVAALEVVGCAAGPAPAALQGASASPAPVAAGLGGDLALASIAVPGRSGVRPARASSASRPDDLIGLDKAALEQRLGSPDMLRRDAPAEVWQYRSSVCVVSVFLYADGAAWHVTYVDLRAPRGAAAVAPGPCFASLSS